MSWGTTYQLFATLYFVLRHDKFISWTSFLIEQSSPYFGQAGFNTMSLGVCMNVFQSIPIVSITVLFDFIKYVSALMRWCVLTEKKKTSMG